MIVFLDFQVDFLNLDAKICNMDFETKNSKAVCLFKDMLSLEPKCNYIIGDLVISHGDEDYTEKLKTVSIIFGSLAIQDTDLDNLEFLEKLGKIANFNGMYVRCDVQIVVYSFRVNSYYKDSQ